MKTAIKMMAVVVLLSLAANSQAQIKVDLKKKLEQQVNRRLNQRPEEETGTAGQPQTQPES